MRRARNIAYLPGRLGRRGTAAPSERKVSFWRQVNSNCLDIAVLDWCKLFGNQKATPYKKLGEH
jgi:hypothetical protein